MGMRTGKELAAVPLVCMAVVLGLLSWKILCPELMAGVILAPSAHLIVTSIAFWVACAVPAIICNRTDLVFGRSGLIALRRFVSIA
ncbi:MAG: hypothetical protein ISR47_02645 [Rhodospirillales bacterium]|nr:hypothetical protein [Rhodospirillales bacterium]